VKLADVCDAVVDCEHKTAPIDPTGKFFAVGTPAMRQNVIDYSQARRIGYETFRAWTRRLQPQYGDLLLAREAPVGPVVSIPREENVAPGQRTVLLRPNAAMCESRFLFYYLAMPSTQGRLNDLAAGSTVAHLNVADVRDFEVELPDLATQTAIADVLGALDDKIAANDREIRLLDELTHALTLAALVRGQRQFALKDFAELTMGSSPTGETLSEDASGVAFHQGVRDFGVRQPTDRIFTSAPVRMARAGDVLISVRAPVGRLNRAAADLCIGRGLAAARTRHCSGATLYNLLRAAPDLWEAHGSDGTVFASISRPQLENLPIGVPDELDQLDVRLTVLEGRVDQLAAESSRLAATRDVLLPELMSGRLTVNGVTGGASE